MTAFQKIENAAAKRLGGAHALESRLLNPEPAESLAMVGNDRYLSVMCRRVDLWAELRHRFTQLGGHSGAAFLRMVGKDTFLLTDWATRAMADWNLYSGKVHTDNGRAQVQALFNRWHAESGRPYCQISQILAFSID